MDSAKIKTIVSELNLESWREQQLRHAFFVEHCSDFSAISTLSRAVREQLADGFAPLTVFPETVLVSKDGRAHKAVLRLHDDVRIESVLLNPKPDLWSCCISSQAGCALKCTFCATGKLGFGRHLSSEEITDQVLFWRQYIATKQLPITLRNVVYMGMGEPLHNRNNVFASLDELLNAQTFNMGARHLSVSTAGMVPAIRELADRFPQVNLAISLHAANDTLRHRLMPINKKYPLSELTSAIADYIEITNRKVFIEYILLDGENDQDSHAIELANFVQRFTKAALLHVNLIVYNPTDSGHRAAARERARRFKDILLQRNVAATIRRNLGRDIDGACGQLAARERQAARP